MYLARMVEGMTSTKLQVTQYSGVYLGKITETHSTNHALPLNTAKFSLDQFPNATGWSPAALPGTDEPPVGTECVVAFEGTSGGNPRILALVGWHFPRAYYGPPSVLPTQLEYGDLWVDTTT